MRRPIRPRLVWMWAIISLLIIWGLVLFFESAKIQRDISTRAQAMMSHTGHGWAKAKIDGRRATLTGQAPHEAAKTEAINLLYGVWGLGGVRDKIIVMADIHPYRFKVSRQGRKLIVFGFTETTGDREGLIKAIAQDWPKFKIINTIKLGGGQPAGWMLAAHFAAKFLRHMTQGSVELKGNDFFVRGVVKNTAAKAALKQNLKTHLPRDYRLADEQITIELP